MQMPLDTPPDLGDPPRDLPLVDSTAMSIGIEP